MLFRSGASGKTIVFGLYKRDGKVYAEIVPDAKAKTLQAIIKGKADIESVIHTDGWRAMTVLLTSAMKNISAKKSSLPATATISMALKASGVTLNIAWQNLRVFLKISSNYTLKKLNSVLMPEVKISIASYSMNFEMFH